MARRKRAVRGGLLMIDADSDAEKQNTRVKRGCIDVKGKCMGEPRQARAKRPRTTVTFCVSYI